MQKFILSVLVLFAIWGGCLPLIELVASMAVSYFFCDIDPDVTYSWYAGIWHGLFFFLIGCGVVLEINFIKQNIIRTHIIYFGGFSQYYQLCALHGCTIL